MILPNPPNRVITTASGVPFVGSRTIASVSSVASANLDNGHTKDSDKG